jgi:hypothetical protein
VGTVITAVAVTGLAAVATLFVVVVATAAGARAWATWRGRDL